VKLPAHRAGLPGNEEYHYKVGFLPAYLPTGRQGGAGGALAGQNSNVPQNKIKKIDSQGHFSKI
jgi:hypothetical protein